MPMATQARAGMGAVSGITSFHHHTGYLGVYFENLTRQQRIKLHVAANEGVAIAAVDHDAPAGKAGLRSNDVILKLNGKKAQHAADLIEALHKMDPGQTVTLDLVRNGAPMQLHIVLADRNTIEQEAWSQHYTVPDPNAQAPAQTGFLGAVPSEIGKTFSSNGGLMSYIPGTPPYTGMTLDVLNPQLARYFGLTNSTGLLVKSIDPNSPGMRAGVQAGDVICKANDAPMTSRSKWNHVLRENRDAAIKLRILRNRQPQTLILTLAEKKS
ncbi:MAG TPA: PDZ domain-containing protein [Acidobacteriaceae bacterium]|nr:PDZ domain-containing protein [Terriglobia bacterium]HVC91093.1 PDZ domain-containing protein [Acidobacteriaceae bacterium]